ncbi:MAG TPA: formate/nitrite transporter family protein [Steroidobacteraceae bacterium]|nr:formate/nitrite transporter family protein [Steroidobacteraceae bacterium]
MDYVAPNGAVAAMVSAGIVKARLPRSDLLIRGALSGALLGVATSLALGAAVQTGQSIVGALVFPAGFVMIVLLGLELVTGSFALLPLAWIERKASAAQVLGNLSWVFLGNLLGALLYAGLLVTALSMMGSAPQQDPLAAKLVAVATAKTLGYQHAGLAGLVTAFVKAMLCNWLVCLGVVMAMTSSSTVGKIAAAWLPIVVFFAQGFEHSVVNMFVIPAGMMLGARVSVADWWLWNQLPVTLGNFVGGFGFTGLALYLAYRDRAVPTAERAPAAPLTPLAEAAGDAPVPAT